jgi:hypothetical protein
MLNSGTNPKTLLVSGLALEFLGPKSLLHKDLGLTKHPKSKVAFPKTEVLGKPLLFVYYRTPEERVPPLHLYAFPNTGAVPHDKPAAKGCRRPRGRKKCPATFLSSGVVPVNP